MPPLVSVIIPTRDRAALLSQALATVLSQRLSPLEVIVVDDASTDGTADLLGSTADERVRTIRHPQGRGVAAARNTGIEAAEGRWLAFLDDDDLWSPDKLLRQLDALMDAPGAAWGIDFAVVVDGDLRVIGAELAPPGRDLSTPLLSANVVPGGGSGVVAERELVMDLGGFDPALSLLADWDLWTRLALRSEAVTVAQPLHAYRLHALSMSAQEQTGEEELAVVDAKYAREREDRGVVLATDAFEFWLADRRQRANRRLASADAYLRSAGHTGAVSAGVRAAAALVWPGSIRHLNARRAARVDPQWVAEAEAWLAPLRTTGGGVLAGQSGAT